MSKVAVYYFPNYHVDPRNETAHGKGWTEWELVKRAEPKYPGHAQPKVPLWGYEDEANPAVMARKIDAAADHAVDAFLFDWYYYEDGPFLNRALEEGFMKAPNGDRLKFALMWANHDWINIHPAKLACEAPLQFPGVVSPSAFDSITDYIVEKYFPHPSYWMPDNRPYFSIYELMTLVRGLGGVTATRDALNRFREKTVAAGFEGLHLNAVVWGIQILPGEETIKNPAEMVAALGFDSVTSYVWIHHVPLNTSPETAYDSVMEQAMEHWRHADGSYGVPYYPNVSMGWDSSPRTVQSDGFGNFGYPFTNIMGDNEPAKFKQALVHARNFLAERPADRRILTINAWNEWTEGSYLEPDTVNGYGYLEALKDVFGGDR